MERDDEDAAPTAAESLRLIKEQRAATERSLSPDARLIYWPWGVAWLVGFGLLFLRYGPDNRVMWNLPGWLPLTTLYVLMVIAFVVSGYFGARSARAVSGDSSVRGFRYGWAWFMGFAGVGVTLSKVTPYLPEAQSGLVWAASSVGVVATMYMAGGAVFKSRDLFVLGVWVGVSNIVGVVVGPGWHSLVIAVACGGGLLVGGAIFQARLRT